MHLFWRPWAQGSWPWSKKMPRSAEAKKAGRAGCCADEAWLGSASQGVMDNSPRKKTCKKNLSYGERTKSSPRNTTDGIPKRKFYAWSAALPFQYAANWCAQSLGMAPENSHPLKSDSKLGPFQKSTQKITCYARRAPTQSLDKLGQ